VSQGLEVSRGKKNLGEGGGFGKKSKYQKGKRWGGGQWEWVKWGGKEKGVLGARYCIGGFNRELKSNSSCKGGRKVGRGSEVVKKKPD